MAQVLQEVNCRNQHTSLHHPKGAKFCDFCNDYVLVDNWHKCTCCLKRVTRKRTFLSDIVRLDKVVQDNENIIKCYLNNPYQSENMPGFVIKIGYRTYLISLSDLANYTKIPAMRNPDRLRPFLEGLESKATLIYPGTRVNSFVQFMNSL